MRSRRRLATGSPAVVIDTVGGLTLSRKLVRKAASDKEVEDAYHARMPVEGVVQGVVKGGYEVKVGRSRAFCPFSQIDTVRTENPEVHVGQTYTFRITEFKDGGRNIVVSRRAVLEAEQQARAEEVRRTIVPGAVLTGRVVSVPPSARSSISAAACRDCCTCPRWGGRASRTRRRPSRSATRSP